MTHPPLPARRDEQIEAMAKAAYAAWEPPFGKLQWHEADLAQGFRAGYLAALAAASPSAGEGKCETCAQWKFGEPDWEFEGLRMGTCARIRMRSSIVEEVSFPEGVGRWDEEGERLIGVAMQAAKAIAVDGSGYYAAVRTAPDFGCILHEPAPSTPAEEAKP